METNELMAAVHAWLHGYMQDAERIRQVKRQKSYRKATQTLQATLQPFMSMPHTKRTRNAHETHTKRSKKAHPETLNRLRLAVENAHKNAQECTCANAQSVEVEVINRKQLASESASELAS